MPSDSFLSAYSAFSAAARFRISTEPPAFSTAAIAGFERAGDLELHRGLELAIAEKTDAVLLAPDHARFLEGGGGDRRLGIEPAGVDRLLDAAKADLVELARRRCW